MDDFDDFRGFVAANGPALLRVAYVLTGDRHRAEDLVQSVLTKLVTRWERIDKHGHAEQYARTMLYREFCSWWRTRRNQEIPRDNLPDGPVADFADAADLRLVLEGALLQLTPRQRAMLTLRFFEDRSEIETAEILDCAVGTVKSQTHKALRRLRSIVPELALSGIEEKAAGGAS